MSVSLLKPASTEFSIRDLVEHAARMLGTGWQAVTPTDWLSIGQEHLVSPSGAYVSLSVDPEEVIVLNAVDADRCGAEEYVAPLEGATLHEVAVTVAASARWMLALL
ncbi:hypothetical protein [Actinacidiphila sp. bgisy160]|uniref:hypothetical protein n=1 Tax=Actinacidiphila sp. bgisy160 TaxID=3413796 RepID=UPI003D70F442